MKIGINTLPNSSTHQTRGVGAYTKNLLQQLRKQQGVEIIEFANLDELDQVDLVHYPFFDFFYRTLPKKKKFPTVVTIHDLTPLLFPKHYPPGIRGRVNFLFQRAALKNVAAILTDSNSSKKDIYQRLKITNDKIFVTYLAASEEFKIIKDQKKLNQVKRKYNLPNKFILFVGDVNYNKNIVNVIKASHEANLPLVMVGKQSDQIENLLFQNRSLRPRDVIRSLLKKPHPELAHFQEVLKLVQNNPAIIRLGFVPIQDLVGVCNLASVVLYPSFYEGFGLPILEAQACGIPVITSNVSSMPEVAGDGAILVDPTKIGEITRAITAVAADQLLRQRLITQGLANIKRFSWEKCAQETVEVYAKVLNY